jgi:hypothetical protein
MRDAGPLLPIAEPLQRAVEIIRANLQRNAAPLQHLLVVAPRGGGKTTFLKALHQSIISDQSLYPHTVVAMVGSLEVGTAGPDHYIDRLAAGFESGLVQSTLNFGLFDEASWTAALSRLHKARAKTSRRRRKLGVLLIDSFDDALTRAFAPKDAQSRLRRLLQSDPDLMLIGAVNNSDVQQNYDERLFQSFLEIDLPEFTPAQLARLATTPQGGRVATIVSEFIGGSPRRALIALNSVAVEPGISAAGLVGRLVAHEEIGFDALLAGLPIRQRRVLDALLVGGEPNRPTRLAELLATTQADIADAVRLLAQGKIIQRMPHSTTRKALYAAADRLFAFWYASQRGGPAYLAELADIVAIDRGAYGPRRAPQLGRTNHVSRAAGYRMLEAWIEGESNTELALKVAAAALVKSQAVGLLEDAADLLAARAGAESTVAALVRSAAAQTGTQAAQIHPDLATALRLLQSGTKPDAGPARRR